MRQFAAVVCLVFGASGCGGTEGRRMQDSASNTKADENVKSSLVYGSGKWSSACFLADAEGASGYSIASYEFTAENSWKYSRTVYPGLNCT